MATRNRRITERRLSEKTRKSSFEEMSARCVAKVRKSKELSSQSLKFRKSFFDWGFWLAAERSYINSSGVELEFYRTVKDFAEIATHSNKKDINPIIKRVVNYFLKMGPVALHVALSYFVSRGFIDAPRKVLIENKLYDWAAAVEEGRGNTTNWESVINLFALSGSENHLRRLIREIPQRASEQNNPLSKKNVKELQTLIREKLKEM